MAALTAPQLALKAYWVTRVACVATGVAGAAGKVYKEVGEREAVVGVGASYAKFVVEGTAPHEIRPVNGGVLAFQVAGKMVFTSLVHHPGTKPNKWMDEAAADTEGQVGVVAAEAWRGVIG